ncbi:MAG TPA: type I 3-dehydroquinate dehydratase [Polyangia bacterium]|nr:type I 3-dehydroquinate dehydratase [Polyangia bacterium]
MLQLSDGPLVVGVADRPATLADCAALPFDRRSFDVVEARIDLFDGQALGGDAAGACARLESTGTPVLVTIRSAAQGGQFKGPETARLALFRDALRVASWADVENDAPIAAEVAALLAGRPDGQLIVSHHDFHRTPPLPELQAVATRCEGVSPGAIAKIATRVDDDADRTVLRALLARHPRRIAVIGMGDEAFRVELAAAGSALAYGFIGAPTAPGQTSAASLHAQLLAVSAAYAGRRRAAARAT